MAEPGLTVADMELLSWGVGKISINGTPMELYGIEQTLQRIEKLLLRLLEEK